MGFGGLAFHAKESKEFNALVEYISSAPLTILKDKKQIFENNFFGLA